MWTTKAILKNLLYYNNDVLIETYYWMMTWCQLNTRNDVTNLLLTGMTCDTTEAWQLTTNFDNNYETQLNYIFSLHCEWSQSTKMIERTQTRKVHRQTHTNEWICVTTTVTKITKLDKWQSTCMCWYTNQHKRTQTN